LLYLRLAPVEDPPQENCKSASGGREIIERGNLQWGSQAGELKVREMREFPIRVTSPEVTASFSYFIEAIRVTCRQVTPNMYQAQGYDEIMLNPEFLFLKI
jgi:hypothetical protein